MTIRVLVADDQPLMRAAFEMILRAEPDIELVGEASDGRDAVDQALRIRPHVVLMDVRMPLVDGVEATRELTARDALIKILILTTFDLDEYVIEAIRAGASGFLLKDVLPDAHADFVFAVAGEEFGVVVCLAIVALFAFIVLRGFSRMSQEGSLFVLLAATGLLVQFGLQAASWMLAAPTIGPQ